MRISTPKKVYTLVQADTILTQRGWNIEMMKIFQRKDIFAVSGRCGHSFDGQDKVGRCSTDVGQPLKDGVKHVFVETETVNRGPLMLHAKRTQELGFLDEQSFFLGGDDHDLMKRSKLKGYVVGYLPVGFYAPLDLSPMRNKELVKHIDSNTKQKEANYKQYRETIQEKHYLNRFKLNISRNTNKKGN
jgi:hypothetical protein